MCLWSNTMNLHCTPASNTFKNIIGTNKHTVKWGVNKLDEDFPGPNIIVRTSEELVTMIVQHHK